MNVADGARRGGILTATIFAVLSVAVLIGLGVWQLERRTWKENLIATLDARLTRAPQALPLRKSWPQLQESRDEYSRVSFSAAFIPGEQALIYTAGSAFRPDVQGPGYWVFSPARLADGSIVVVDRGFIPFERKGAIPAAPPGAIDIVGVMRWPEQAGLFTPDDEPQNNVWYLRDPQRIAAAKKWTVDAPFYVEQETPGPPGGLPKPGKLVVALPDNHLQYAITWFGLAAGLIGVYGVWVTGRLRR